MEKNRIPSLRRVKDRIGFCWDEKEMEKFVDFLSTNKEQRFKNTKTMIGAISAHDDYLYAGKIYYQLFKEIKAKEVIIFGLTHMTVREVFKDKLEDFLIFEDYERWESCFEEIEISPFREYLMSKLDKDDFIVNNQCHSVEHSIEALLPFLQYFNRNVKITPIMVSRMNPNKNEELSKKVSKAIFEYASEKKLELGKDLFVLISNDANHYGKDFDNIIYGIDKNAHKMGTENDKRILEKLFSKQVRHETIQNIYNEIIPNQNNKEVPIWCGRYPIYFGVQTLLYLSQLYEKDLESEILKYSDTFTEKVLNFSESSMGLTAPFSLEHWVGFFASGFFM